MRRSSQRHQPDRKRVLARLKKPGRPLKTIRLMKYVKAHKETLRPFRKVGGGGWVCRRKLGKYAASAKKTNTQKALSIRISSDVKSKTKGTLRREKRGLYLSRAVRVYGP